MAFLPALDRELRSRGIVLRPNWAAAALAHLGPQHAAQPLAAQAEALFGLFLCSDANASGGGGLPPGVAGMARGKLEGRFVLQCDEAVNIAAAFRER